MSQKYVFTAACVFVVCMLMLVTLTACGEALPEGAVSELETGLHHMSFLRGTPADDYEISSVHSGEKTKMPSSIDERWCVEVALNSNGQTAIERYFVDQSGESFNCRRVTEASFEYYCSIKG